MEELHRSWTPSTRRVYPGAFKVSPPLQETHVLFLRSKKETDRLHRLNKPKRATHDDDLPSIDSHDEDEGSWSSGLENSLGSSDDGGDDIPSEDDSGGDDSDDDDAEMSYEKAPRKRRPEWEPTKTEGVQGLPIKLADGRVRQTGTKVATAPVVIPDEDTSEEEVEEEDSRTKRMDDVSTGARFGRPAVVDVVGNKSQSARIHGAKEQIAGICQEIVADPENSVRITSSEHFAE